MIGGFRSDMSITRMIDGNFWKRFRECFVFQSRISTKTVVMLLFLRMGPNRLLYFYRLLFNEAIDLKSFKVNSVLVIYRYSSFM